MSSGKATLRALLLSVVGVGCPSFCATIETKGYSIPPATHSQKQNNK